MVLVFGGTTEGRKAAEVLEEAGTPYYYSTKTGEQDLTLHHGLRTDGALDREAMLAFCREHDIRLMVDAAHPFAVRLHQTIADVSRTLSLPVIRYERIYPDRDPSLTWIDDYAELATLLPPSATLLATTGVQSIAKLKPLEAQGIRIVYRILPRPSSISLAHQQGATDDQLCYYEDAADIPVRADAILLKESGLSGGFQQKVDAARALGMRIIAVKRPTPPGLPEGEESLRDPSAQPTPPLRGGWEGLHTVNGPHGLRRMVERLLPDFYPLHSGLTTGTCATAAAVAATLQLVRTPPNLPEGEEGLRSSSAQPTPPLRGGREGFVPVRLPNGETITVPVGYGDGYAYCIKEAGDDPDVTNGLEIRARVIPSHPLQTHPRPLPVREGSNMSQGEKSAEELSTPLPHREGLVVGLLGGEGVGRFTLPGFDYPPGSPAINKGPRQMIRDNVMAVANLFPFAFPLSLKIEISVPRGREVAARTFNPRLGIEGGISIIGVSGIVKPFSEEAFISSIRKCMEVAKASGAARVVINSGGKSERFVRARYPDLPQQAFVEYGNYIGETLKIAHDLGIPRVTLGVMLGKAVKLAQGHLDTHSKKTTMDKTFVATMLQEAGCAADLSNLTLARELWIKLPQEKLDAFARVVISHCLAHCRPLLPDGQLTILLIDEEGRIFQ